MEASLSNLMMTRDIMWPEGCNKSGSISERPRDAIRVEENDQCLWATQRCCGGFEDDDERHYGS
jgi:hypothetical protein